MKVKICVLFILAFSQFVLVYGQKNEHSPKKIVITGTVFNKDNEPQEGAVIFVDTLFTKSISDEQGNYRVKVDPSAKTITAVLPDKAFGQNDINGSKVVNLTVLPVPNKIPPFASRAIKANIKSITKSQRLNTYPNIYEMIRAEVPGVTVSGSSITVKQGHSFFGSSTPIFIVNGVKVPSIDYIIPTQVKKIELLTGSSAAMYVGVEGTTGVIKITLLSGGDQ
jgi:TonB-dependent starch-binding outer membrane protein SusC